MRKVDSAFLVAAACGIWAQLALEHKDLFNGTIALAATMIWLFRALSRYLDKD